MYPMAKESPAHMADPRASIRRQLRESRLAKWARQSEEVASSTAVQLDGYGPYRARMRRQWEREIQNGTPALREAEADHAIADAWMRALDGENWPAFRGEEHRPLSTYLMLAASIFLAGALVGASVLALWGVG